MESKKVVKTISRKTHTIDAKGESLGRLASRAALLLRGKHKVNYVPHIDQGDKVIVRNAGQLQFIPNKLNTKIYYRHTRWVGHLHQKTLGQMFKESPSKVVEMAVRGMLPKNKLAQYMLKRLKVYA